MTNFVPIGGTIQFQTFTITHIFLKRILVYICDKFYTAQRPDQTNWHAQMQKDLLLTLDWNSPHVAMSEVFLKDPSSKFKVIIIVFHFFVVVFFSNLLSFCCLFCNFVFHFFVVAFF